MTRFSPGDRVTNARYPNKIYVVQYYNVPAAVWACRDTLSGDLCLFDESYLDLEAPIQTSLWDDVGTVEEWGIMELPVSDSNDHVCEKAGYPMQNPDDSCNHWYYCKECGDWLEKC